MSQTKKQIRQAFRDDCLKRDNYRCRKCNASGELDVHHITDRKEIINGGYVKENGISLCSECHELAELFHSSEGKRYHHDYLPEDLYNLINSSLQKAIIASEKL